MKKLNIFLYLVLLTMVFFMGFFVQKSINIYKAENFVEKENATALKLLRMMDMQNTKIADFHVMNTKGDTITLSSLLDHEKFVIYWSRIDCAACAVKEFMLFDEYFSELDKSKNIILLGNFKNMKEQKVIEQTSHLKTYNVLDNNFFDKANKEDLFVTYCMLDSSLIVSNYLDAKDNNTNIDINRIYYKVMSKRFQNMRQ